jgi:hypothetical protein
MSNNLWKEREWKGKKKKKEEKEKEKQLPIVSKLEEGITM